MTEWYVGRKANFHLNWHESYRRLLRTIDAHEESAVVRVIRRSKPIQSVGKGRKKHQRGHAEQKHGGYSEWADKDYYIYLGIAAPSYAQALQVGKDIFAEAERAFQVGFGDIFPPQVMDERLSEFLIPTEFPSDGRIPAEPPREDEDIVGGFAFYELPTLPPLLEATDPRLFDRLLSWLSAAGEGRWESFLRVAGVLGAAPDLPTARRLFRRFVLLGHIESSPEGRTWFAAPPVLVQAARSVQNAFWCGSRGAALLARCQGPGSENRPVRSQTGSALRACHTACRLVNFSEKDPPLRSRLGTRRRGEAPWPSDWRPFCRMSRSGRRRSLRFRSHLPISSNNGNSSQANSSPSQSSAVATGARS